MSFVIRMCNNSTSPVECAPFGDNYELLDEYLARHSLFMQKTTNYVDYDEVEPFVGPVKQTSQVVESLQLEGLNKSVTQMRKFSFIET